ncbi:MAG: response regulator [Verrucomicrobia bacterium]|nr:response regulator [Verrucomicrobiota bacterium]
MRPPWRLARNNTCRRACHRVGNGGTMSQTSQMQQGAPVAKRVWRVLIVDDEESIRDLFTSIFRAPDYHTAAAPSGRAALAMAGEQAFDLAFIDYSMPEMNGVETSRRLRQALPLAKTVIISGFPVSDRAAMVEQAGASAFLAKPFSVEAVRSLAERLLGIR